MITIAGQAQVEMLSSEMVSPQKVGISKPSEENGEVGGVNISMIDKHYVSVELKIRIMILRITP
jgi:hypothetical protein